MADVELTVVIPDAHVAEFKEAFLHEMPKPEDIGMGGPTYTDKEWLTECVRVWLVSKYRRGRQKLRAQAATYPDVIPVVT